MASKGSAQPASGGVYQSPLARLSPQQYAQLRGAHAGRASFHQLERQAAHLLGELSIRELRMALPKIVAQAFAELGTTPGQLGFEMQYGCDDARGMCSIKAVVPGAGSRTAGAGIWLCTTPVRGADFVVPKEPSRWKDLAQQVAVRLKREIRDARCSWRFFELIRANGYVPSLSEADIDSFFKLEPAARDLIMRVVQTGDPEDWEKVGVREDSDLLCEWITQFSSEPGLYRGRTWNGRGGEADGGAEG